MRIEQLEYIAAVTEHGSLRRAGERLHVSQPALSEAVAKLERELGVTLLDRRRSGARISRRGADLLQPMIDVLDAVAAAQGGGPHGVPRVTRGAARHRQHGDLDPAGAGRRTPAAPPTPR